MLFCWGCGPGDWFHLDCAGAMVTEKARGHISSTLPKSCAHAFVTQAGSGVILATLVPEIALLTCNVMSCMSMDFEHALWTNSHISLASNAG